MTNLSLEQIAAMKLTRELGLILQRDIPEMANDRREGRTRTWIVEHYDVINKYGTPTQKLTMRSARESVYCALYGHVGGLGIESYPGLIGKEEQRRISGSFSVEFHSPGGKKASELKVGAHAKYRRIENGKKLGDWEEDRDTLLSLAQDPEYHFQEGPYKGRVNIRLIADKLNRTPSPVKSALFRFRKKREKQEQAS